MYLYLFLVLNIEIKAPKFNFLPKIDGIISEFENFEKITDFVESQPEEGKIPPVKTISYIAYDENNIYFAFKCYDDINSVRKTLTKRDEFAMDDMVVIFLDTYGKEKEGYIFGTNPLGVQFDGIKGPPPHNIEDYSFDTYFEVKSFISDSFWSAEFRIPFSSLRFESKDKQSWKFLLGRIRPRGSLEVYIFPGISRGNPSFFAQGATLIIPERIYAKEKRYEIIPYLISSQSGIRETEYKNDRGKFNLGLSGKTRILENLVLDYAINPDFAQIETDAPQIDVNTTYALYYPEKRPLFMEGSQSLGMPINVIYTRMINNPLYALKLTGKISYFDLYLLSSYDENTPYILPFEDASFDFPTDKKSFVNILRLKSDFLNKESHIGFIIGIREVKKDEFDNGFGRNFGFDTKLKFLEHYIFGYQGVYSITKEPNDSNLFNFPDSYKFRNYTWKFDGEEFSGFAQKVNFRTFFRNFIASLYYDDFSPTFRSDLGYIMKNNFKNFGVWLLPRIYPNKYGFNEINVEFQYEKELNYDKVSKNEEFTFGFRGNLNFAQMNFEINLNNMNKRVYNLYIDDYQYFKDLRNLDFYLNLIPWKWLLIRCGGQVGNSIYYAYPEYMPAYEIYLWNSFNLLLTKFIFSFGFERYYLYKEKYKHIIYDVSTIWNGLRFSFTHNLSFRFTFTYNSYYKNPGFYPLFSYEVNPFTVFYFGANINTKRYNEKLEGESHQIFLKFQYLFRL